MGHGDFCGMLWAVVYSEEADDCCLACSATVASARASIVSMCSNKKCSKKPENHYKDNLQSAPNTKHHVLV